MVRKYKKTKTVRSKEQFVKQLRQGRQRASQKKNKIAKRKTYKRMKAQSRFHFSVRRSLWGLLFLLFFPYRAITNSDAFRMDVVVSSFLESK